MLCIGIDISKARFDCALFIEKGCQNKSFSNDNKGFKALFKWLVALGATQDRVFCMEATGVYGVALSGNLYQLGEKAIVANPMKPHAFAKMEMMRNKTDKADAISIARYCQHIVSKGELEKNLLWTGTCCIPVLQEQKTGSSPKRSRYRVAVSGYPFGAVRQTVDPREKPFAGELEQGGKQINQSNDPAHQAAKVAC